MTNTNRTSKGMSIDDALHIVRNQWGHSDEYRREARLVLADEVERLRRKLEMQKRSAVETSAPQAPIARMMVADGFVSWAHLKAPGLPDGMHDVFCEPEVIAPYLGMRHTLQEIRDHSTDTWAKGLARESVGPRLCPHGMPADENICGPCSRGEPNRRHGSPEEPRGDQHVCGDGIVLSGTRAQCPSCREDDPGLRRDFTMCECGHVAIKHVIGQQSCMETNCPCTQMRPVKASGDDHT